MGERGRFVPVSGHFVGTRAQLSKRRQSDECASCLQVNGGIELRLWSGVLGEAKANFLKPAYNGMCASVCERCAFCEHTHLAQWIWSN